MNVTERAGVDCDAEPCVDFSLSHDPESQRFPQKERFFLGHWTALLQPLVSRKVVQLQGEQTRKVLLYRADCNGVVLFCGSVLLAFCKAFTGMDCESD